MSLRGIRNEHKTYVEYLFEKLTELKDVVGPLDEVSDPSRGRIELVFDGITLNITENYMDRDPLLSSLNMDNNSNFYRAATLIYLIGNSVQSNRRGADIEVLKKTVDDDMLGKFGKWLNSAVLSNAIKWTYKTLLSFEEGKGMTVMPLYQLKGRVGITLPDYSPEDFE
jgi:hypothetical protein